MSDPLIPATPDPLPVSRHVDRLFARIRDVIKDGFADADFGAREVAAEAGISLRYLQKLFTARGSTCSEFIFRHRFGYPQAVHSRTRNSARRYGQKGASGPRRPASSGLVRQYGESYSLSPLVTDALVMAIWRRGKPDALLHHSDRDLGSLRMSNRWFRRRPSLSW